MVMADLLAIVTGLLASVLVQTVVRPGVVDARTHVALAATTLPLWMGVLALNRLYRSPVIANATDELRRIVNSAFITVGLTVIVAFSVQLHELSRLWMTSVLVLVTTALVVERSIARSLIAGMRRTGRLRQGMLIVGTDAQAIGLLHALTRRPELGYDVVGFAGPDSIGVRAGRRVLGDIDDIDAILDRTGATSVAVSARALDGATLNRMTRFLTDRGIDFMVLSGLRDIDLARFMTQDIDGRTLFHVDPVIRDGWRALAKRAFDVAIACAGLLVTAPLLIAALIAIRLDSRGPLLFRQARAGQDGRPFEILKLRTMSVDADARKHELQHLNEADGPLFKIDDDPRVTRVGRVLRRLSIDEIPQFINVLRGDMSVVGPRPATPDEVEQWDAALYDRLRVLPGITGLWQVSGRSDTSFDDYKRFDLFYVDNWSLAHDVRIVARTVGVVLGRRGAR
jgi:exopolysaccharide biosynthesis polyprenyl glycosylphosphotransferase